ncbi:MAG: hypothetical protein KatS3mg077_0374 [Candidatus Binatia bacterium]|nr:MAG: hypothetical protein KatS3mg077_0374 [Candidatus Binatia bacterium]
MRGVQSFCVFVWTLVALEAGGLLLAGCEAKDSRLEAKGVAQVREVRPAPLGVRVSMEELHASGGVPPGWKFSPPPGDREAGRKAFADLGCYKCHRIAGESFPAHGDGGKYAGPDLTGMGSHHPPGYFAEAIVNPNAVLVEGPGYLDENGASRMPMYPDMTLQQLADLVEYLASLKEPEASAGTTSGHEHHSEAEHAAHHGHRNSGGGIPDLSRLTYFAQAYEVDDGRLDEFYQWFDERRFRDIPGLVRIDTYASRERREGKHTILVLFGFEHDGAMESFRKSRAAMPSPTFVRPVEHFLFESPPLYRAVQMSHP